VTIIVENDPQKIYLTGLDTITGKVMTVRKTLSLGKRNGLI